MRTTQMTVQDRCDACGAQAFTVFYKAISEDDIAPAVLLFCGHHTGENELALRADEWTCGVDERSSINTRPSVNASV